MYISGCSTEQHGDLLRNIFEKPYFRCSVVMDVETVEMCGALKVCTLCFVFSGRYSKLIAKITSCYHRAISPLLLSNDLS